MGVEIILKFLTISKVNVENFLESKFMIDVHLLYLLLYLSPDGSIKADATDFVVSCRPLLLTAELSREHTSNLLCTVFHRQPNSCAEMSSSTYLINCRITPECFRTHSLFILLRAQTQN